MRPSPDIESGRWQVSTGGGSRPAWARNGRELFYLDNTNLLMAVPVQTAGATFVPGNPAKVLNKQYASTGTLGRYYDMSPDGRRFLMIKDANEQTADTTPASMVVVLNWIEELKQRVQAK